MKMAIDLSILAFYITVIPSIVFSMLLAFRTFLLHHDIIVVVVIFGFINGTSHVPVLDSVPETEQ